MGPFDYHLLKKRMSRLLNAAACVQTKAHSRCRHQCSPSIPASGSSTERLSLPSSCLLCLPLSRAASLQAVPERPLPATPAVGLLASESTMPTMLRLLRCLTPAQPVPILLWCLKSSNSACLSSGSSPPSPLHWIKCNRPMATSALSNLLEVFYFRMSSESSL